MFQFKQFTIQQQSVSMKVNTDGVLLGAWAKGNNAQRILDIGTGTGVIALMLAQRNANAVIDAVEVDEVSVQQAQENINDSPWNNRISIIWQTFQTFAKKCSQQYDLIVSNPPYFVDALLPPSAVRTRARHSEELTHEELIFYTKKIIAPEGAFCVVLPFDEGLRFVALAGQQGFFLINRTAVFPLKNKPPKRLLLQFSLSEQPLFEDSLFIHEEKGFEYTQEYKSLTKDFYLKF